MNRRVAKFAVLLALCLPVVNAIAEAQEPTSRETAAREAGERPVRSGDGRLVPPRNGADGGDAWPWIRTGLALAVVVVLVLLARWLLRGVATRGLGAGRGGPMRVLARTALSGRHQLLLVRLGERLLLVGASAGQLNTLSEITDPAERDRLLEAIGQGEKVPTNKTGDEPKQEDTQ